MKSKVLFGICTSLLIFILSSCQIAYLSKSSYYQADLFFSQKSINDSSVNESLSPEQKRKIDLIQKAREFAFNELGLKKSSSYTSFVDLKKLSWKKEDPSKREYVTYVVSAAPKNKLEHFEWKYPLVGSLPYKGFFIRADADLEALELKKQNLDVYIRGVTAYSTLGWLKDPILSSMLQYEDEDLVNTIIHELTHATVFISNANDFNERLASFVGNQGTLEFYRKFYPNDFSIEKRIQDELKGEKLFSEFIEQKLQDLDLWYTKINESNPNYLTTPEFEIERQKKFSNIQEEFKNKIRPLLGPYHYQNFETAELNNAKLLVFKLYQNQLTEFELLFNKYHRNWYLFLKFFKDLDNSKGPEEALQKSIQGS